MKKRIKILCIALLAIIASCKKDSTKNPDEKKPEACFSFTASNFQIGDYLNISNCSKNNESYEWQVNNVVVSGSDEPYYRFDSAGTYSIKLTVTASDGSINSTTKSLTVQNQFKKFEGNWEIVESIDSDVMPTYTSNITVDNTGKLTVTNFGEFRRIFQLTADFSSFPISHEGSKIVNLPTNTVMTISELYFNDVTSPYQFSASGYYNEGSDYYYLTMNAIKD